LFDVAEEEGIGTNDEHALSLEGESVGVEEVRSTVERNGGLPRSWPTLHEECACEGGANDFVLLALNGRHDVAHLPRSRSAEGCKEGSSTADWPFAGNEAIRINRCSNVVTKGREGAVRIGEELVFNAKDGSVLHAQVATTDEAERIPSGGSVERLSDWCSPVNDERTPVFAGNRQAPNVEGLWFCSSLGRCEINPTEAEWLFSHIELGQACERPPDDNVPFGPRLERTPATEVEH
jgi:hypothetical protein